MIQRCTNPKRESWHLYGGRGIKVCERWRIFKDFAFDMGPRPSMKHTLDRMNPNGNYEPGNCRWATPKEQTETRRRKLCRICVNCGSPTNGDSYFGKCHKCNEYIRRNGVDRPSSHGEVVRLRNLKASSIRRKCVYQFKLNGEFVALHESVKAAARVVGSKHYSSISLCAKGKQKSPTAGFLWRYEHSQSDLPTEHVRALRLNE